MSLHDNSPIKLIIILVLFYNWEALKTKIMISFIEKKEFQLSNFQIIIKLI